MRLKKQSRVVYQLERRRNAQYLLYGCESFRLTDHTLQVNPN